MIHQRPEESASGQKLHTPTPPHPPHPTPPHPTHPPRSALTNRSLLPTEQLSKYSPGKVILDARALVSRRQEREKKSKRRMWYTVHPAPSPVSPSLHPRPTYRGGRSQRRPKRPIRSCRVGSSTEPNRLRKKESSVMNPLPDFIISGMGLSTGHAGRTNRQEAVQSSTPIYPFPLPETTAEEV